MLNHLCVLDIVKWLMFSSFSLRFDHPAECGLRAHGAAGAHAALVRLDAAVQRLHHHRPHNHLCRHHHHQCAPKPHDMINLVALLILL